MDYQKEKEKLDRELRADREHVETWYQEERRKRVADQNREWKTIEHLSPPEQAPMYERHQEAMRSLDNLKAERMKTAETVHKVGMDALNKHQQQELADRREKARAAMDRIQGREGRDNERDVGKQQEAKKPTLAERMKAILSRKDRDNEQELD